jgi:tetratricopeptide (TPR) repeat protein
MRMQIPVIRYVVLLLALVFSTGTVAADSRSEAKAHYQAGVKLYSGGDYKGAIKEFSAAQELAPADLNNYNLALCYDKLGDPEPAIQYYRAFLDKQPGSDKKAEIESSIARLENAAKSAAAKRAAKEKDEEAKRLAEQKKADEEARKADEARRAAEAKRPPDEIRKDPEGPAGPVGVGSTGTPGGTGTVSTGDAQLDRVQRIDVNQIRDQRVGGATSGMPAQPPAAPGTAASGGNAAANIDVNAQASGGAPATAGPAPVANANNPNAAQPGQPDPSDKKATPVYKKWWFWAVIAVSAYVVISIATEDKNDDTASRVMPMGRNSNSPAAATGGMTLMRW